MASLVFLYSRAPVYFSPGEFIRPFILLGLVLLLLYLLTGWILRDHNWTGLLLVVLVLGFFSSMDFAYIYSLTVLSIFILVWAAYRFHFVARPGMKHVYFVVQVVGLVAITLALFSIYPALNTIPDSYYGNTWNVVHSKRYLGLDPVSNARPDIYYIVLDEYGRSDILSQIYGFDNSDFVNHLEQKGFIVPQNSRSNYARTVLSVASTLNMDYIDDFAPQLEKSSLWWLMSPWLDHSLVRTSLQRIGYRSVSISTEWSITDNPTTDIYYKSHPVMLSDFERYVLSETPLYLSLPALQDWASVPTYEAHRRVELNNFDALIKSSSLPGPKFVFAHLLLPHPPFVFSDTGSPIDPEYPFTLKDADAPGMFDSSEQYQAQYVDQVQFLNSQLERVVDTILENSDRPPIIILQADHGPRLLTDFSSPQNTCLAESFSTFSAYYLPGMEAGTIPDDITSVNIFRIVFDRYFNADVPLLKNKEYYPRYGLGFYNFEDITNGVGTYANCGVDSLAKNTGIQSKRTGSISYTFSAIQTIYSVPRSARGH
ncbi:MAG: sulfatase-like hydrolase/transferase [Bacteroidota bacterium]